MTLQQLEATRNQLQGQYAAHLNAPTAPGGETMKHLNAIEIQAAIKAVNGLIDQERASLFAPPGATGPTL